MSQWTHRYPLHMTNLIWCVHYKTTLMCPLHMTNLIWCVHYMTNVIWCVHDMTNPLTWLIHYIESRTFKSWCRRHSSLYMWYIECMPHGPDECRITHEWLLLRIYTTYMNLIQNAWHMNLMSGESHMNDYYYLYTLPIWT